MPSRPDNSIIPALGYDRLTPFYDLVAGLTTRERRFKQALLRQADIQPGQRVLDLACGTGTLAIWGRQRYPEAQFIGIDGDARMLARARTKTRRHRLPIVYDQALTTALPYADACFDRVLSSLFFHHLSWPDKLTTAREAWRVLKPGGEFHVADWGKPATPLMRLPFYIVQLFDGFETTRDNIAGRLPEAFEAAGFSKVERSSQLPTLFGTLWLYRTLKSSGSI